MTALRKLMSVEEFLIWALERPERWELYHGTPVMMSPERAIHARVKNRVTRALEAAVVKAGLPCEVFADGLTVRIDAQTSYQPDALITCGDAVPDDAIVAATPIIVVEVLSPSTAMKDVGDKLRGYFLVASIQHYLIVDPDEHLVIHHTRGDSGTISTRVLKEGSIRIEPPGLELALSLLFHSATDPRTKTL